MCRDTLILICGYAGPWTTVLVNELRGVRHSLGLETLEDAAHTGFWAIRYLYENYRVVDWSPIVRIALRYATKSQCRWLMSLSRQEPEALETGWSSIIPKPRAGAWHGVTDMSRMSVQFLQHYSGVDYNHLYIHCWRSMSQHVKKYVLNRIGIQFVLYMAALMGDAQLAGTLPRVQPEWLDVALGLAVNRDHYAFVYTFTTPGRNWVHVLFGTSVERAEFILGLAGAMGADRNITIAATGRHELLPLLV